MVPTKLFLDLSPIPITRTTKERKSRVTLEIPVQSDLQNTELEIPALVLGTNEWTMGPSTRLCK